MSQANKAKIAERLKKIIPADWKWSLSVNHHSTLVLTISAAPVDLIDLNLVQNARREVRPQYIDVNEYYIEREYAEPLCTTFKSIKAAMMVGNHDNSDPMTDYFDVGWYIDIKIGRFERPFRILPSAAKTEPTYEELKARVAALEARLC